MEKRERLPVSVSAAVFITDSDGRLLLVKQAAEKRGGKWSPPGGGMEAHENPLATAQRETREEIGVDVSVLDLIGVYTVDRGDRATGIGFVFRGEILPGKNMIKDREIEDIQYFTPQEVEQLIADGMIYKPEYNLSAIKDWRNGISYPLDVLKPLIKG